MKKIKIVESDLLNLLEEYSGSREGYIDKQTGEILELFDDYDGSELDEIIEKREQDRSRYLKIEPIESREGFRIMERFVASLPEDENRNLFIKVLSWKKPFSNFKSALTDMGDLRDQWFDFHDKELRRLALEWLESEEIHAEFVSCGEGFGQSGG